jgi:hypothetical protein
MGLSETILAAMIGAIATVGTAIFQLLTAFKARGKPEVKPKRGTTLRSILAVFALMVASAAGGFLYSQLLRERDAEDFRAMRQELRELRDLTASRVREREEQLADSARLEAAPAMPALTTSFEPAMGTAESVAYVPACRVSPVAADRVTSDCQESDAQRIALCGTIPAYARVSNIALYAQPDAVQHPWEQHTAALEADLGGARFTGKTFEYAQGQELKAVCVNFVQWSSQHPHIARIVLQYATGGVMEDEPAPPAPAESSPSVLTQTTVSADSIQAAPQAAAFAAPTALR